MEYPAYGTGDFRYPAFDIRQKDGSRITDFKFEDYRVIHGKPKLKGLPATYVEVNEEAETLELILRDRLLGVKIILSYTIFRDYPAIARNARFVCEEGAQSIVIERALSLSIDLPDSEFDLVQLSGAWSRERHIKTRKIMQAYRVFPVCGGQAALSIIRFLR